MKPNLTPFLDALPRLPILRPTARADDRASYYLIEMRPALVRMHGELPTTTLWGFNGQYPGPTIEARVHSPVVVTWINSLPGPHPIRPLVVPPPGRGASQLQPGRDGQDFLSLREPIPIWTSIHLHGGRTPPDSDGMPVNAFFPNHSSTCTYPNRQRAAALWYHDNAMGQSRVNVYAGLFGAYLLRDDGEQSLGLPSNASELVLMLHDVNLDLTVEDKFTGELLYKLDDLDGEFFGPYYAVNGKIWPYAEVEPRQYRLRLINASVARCFSVQLTADSPAESNAGMTLIGTDGGLLEAPISIPAEGLRLGPGERADVIADFRSHPGQKVYLCDYDRVHPPACNPGLPTEGPPLMQFRVGRHTTSDLFVMPQRLCEPVLTELTGTERVRTIALEYKIAEGTSARPPGRRFLDCVDATPELNSTEIWDVQNHLSEPRMFHAHLAQCRVLGRTDLHCDSGEPMAPADLGLKDTVYLPPHSTTRLALKFAGHTGLYVYRYSAGGHRDSDMVRPFLVVPQGTNRI